MIGFQEKKAGEHLKVLNEAEIHDRLYGEYHGGRKRNQKTVLQKANSREEKPWTGSEILSDELNRLRSELIRLKKEQEQIQTRIHRPNTHPVLLANPEKPTRANRWGSLLAVAVFLVGLMVPVSFRLIQASPQVVGGDATPYTVQVAVYDIEALARQAVGHLNRLGYSAYLVEKPRDDGRSRYNIQLGSFVTREEARLEKRRLLSDPRFGEFRDAFVKFH